MDEQALNELLECSVCLERLDPSSKVLPCQHTFCRRCLDEIVSTKHELRCPECRAVVPGRRVDELPANILLVRLLEGLRQRQNRDRRAGGQVQGVQQVGQQQQPQQQQRRRRVGAGRRGGGEEEEEEVVGEREERSPARRGFEVKALYNYDAKEPGDLAFKKGDLISVCRQIDPNWFFGELNGQEGYFPSSYVQVVANFHSALPQVKALYDFDIKDDNEKDCLKFQKDEILQLIRRVDENWLEGRRSDQIGIFPVSFVELNDAAKILVASRSRSSSASSSSTTSGSGRGPTPATGGVGPYSPQPQQQQQQHLWQHLAPPPPPPPQAAGGPAKRHSFTAGHSGRPAHSPPPTSSAAAAHHQQQRRSLELPSPTAGGTGVVPLQVALPPPPPPPPPAMKLLTHLDKSEDLKTNTPELNNPDLPTKNVIYSALYNYRPQKDDELELRKGDLYAVAERCQDGWYKGRCLRTGIGGVFPGNYMQAARHSSGMRAREPPQPSEPAGPPAEYYGGAPPPPCGGDTPPPAPPPAMVAQGAGRRSRPLGHVASTILAAAPSVKNNSSGTTSAGEVAVPVPPPPPAGTATSGSVNTPATPASATTATAANAAGGGGVGGTPATTAALLHPKPGRAVAAAAGASVTPGVSGGSTPGHGTPKEKKEKKEKDKPSLVKRLTMGKGKKPKSLSEGGSDESPTNIGSDSYAGHTRYRCIAPYPPQGELELELRVGDVVLVRKRRDDGWFRGALARTGRHGLFPGSFVTRCDP